MPLLIGQNEICNQDIFKTITARCFKLNQLIEVKETKSATMNIFEKFSFLKMLFVKVELSYVFTINLFTIAENCMEK